MCCEPLAPKLCDAEKYYKATPFIVFSVTYYTMHTILQLFTILCNLKYKVTLNTINLYLSIYLYSTLCHGTNNIKPTYIQVKLDKAPNPHLQHVELRYKIIWQSTLTWLRWYWNNCSDWNFIIINRLHICSKLHLFKSYLSIITFNCSSRIHHEL